MGTRISSRPFDPTASTLLNLIVGEHRPLLNIRDYVFIPSHGPFYANTLVVRSGDRILLRGRDYDCKVLHVAGSKVTGKEVSCIILIKDRTLSSVSIDYQVVGGQYMEVYSELKSIIDNLGSEYIETIEWLDIADKPAAFNPAAHYQPYWEFKGWEMLYDSLSAILNGITHRKQSKLEQTYKFLDTEIAKFNVWFGQQRTQLHAQFTLVADRTRDQQNSIRLINGREAPPERIYGKWESITTIGKDRILGIAGSNATLGTNKNINLDVKYPHPDNILFDEQDAPITRDDDEWIYLDNQYPVYPYVSTSPSEGIDFTAQVFDLHHFRAWSKVANTELPTATLTADKTTISDDGTVTFTLRTVNYPAGMEIAYLLEGVGSENISVPIYGTLRLPANGVVSFPVKLLRNSPATYSDTMTLRLGFHNLLSRSVKYTLSSNAIADYDIGFVETIGDLKRASMVPYETIYVKIDQLGIKTFEPKLLDLTFRFSDNSRHPIMLDFNTPVTAGVVTRVSHDADTDWYAISVNPTSFTAATTLNVALASGGRTLANASIRVDPITARVYVESMTTATATPTVVDEEPFRFVCITNAVGVLNTTITNTTVGNQLRPNTASPTPVISGKAQTNVYTVSRTNRSMPDSVTMQFALPSGQVLGTYRLTIPAQQV